MDAGNIEIRPAAIEDAAGIARVHVASWQFAYRGIVPSVFLDGLSVERRTEFWEHAVTPPLPHAITCVAVHDDRIVGFCSCGPARDDDADERRGEIAAIYVDPASVRKGVGRRLMDAALGHLAREGFSEAKLWVLKDNPIGRGFYERSGWTSAEITRTETIGGAEVIELQYRIGLPPSR